MGSYVYQEMPYHRPAELDRPGPRRPVIIIGAGPIGMAAAIDLAQHGIPCIVLDDNNVVSVGSRAICWSKRTLEIFDRLGVGQRMLDKGVTWKLGRVFHGDREVYSFDLLPEAGHRMPAFVNLQQYYVEEYLVDRCDALAPLVELRWLNKVVDVHQQADHVRVTVETQDGAYEIDADWVLAADGARSPTRRMLGLDFQGKVFEDRFLIADVRMKADFPTERWFWFDPPFHSGQSALLHRQPDDVFRIDLQLGWDADPEEEKKQENVIPRIKAVVGPDTPFDLEWVSVYTFQCRRLEKFVHDRVIFVGDSAHQVSPFGARGGNGGIQDIDNLVWKLARVIDGKAPVSLLETYDEERVHGADENILNSTRATDFLTPKSSASQAFRDGVLSLASDHPFARRLVNSGRLSLPCSLAGMTLQSTDDVAMGGEMVPGSACADAVLKTRDGNDTWLLHHLGGDFVFLVFATATSLSGPSDIVNIDDLDARVVFITDHAGAQGTHLPDTTTLLDFQGTAFARYDAQPGTAYLIRPDQHVAARSLNPSKAWLTAAVNRATGRETKTPATTETR